jgi:hypothetical protein
MIRHAEKPPKNSLGEDPPGLSAEGITRAEALVQIFGINSNYDINYILAEHPNKSKAQRALILFPPLTLIWKQMATGIGHSRPWNPSPNIWV